MGGAARGGFAAERPDLFHGRPWIFTPHTDGSGVAHPKAEALEKLFAFVSALGAVPWTMDAADHDRQLAFLSHLPQLTASALMAVVGGAAAEALPLAGRGLVDTTRLAASPADIWRDIAATNADLIRPALDRLIAQLTALRDGLAEGDAIDRAFEEANHWREKLMEGREL